MSKVKVFVEPEHRKIISIGNAVTRSAQSLTLAEKRILFTGLTKLRGVNKQVSITAKEYAETFGLDDSTAYRQLKEAAKTLFNRYLRFNEVYRKKEMVTYVRWIGSYGYTDQEGVATFRFTEEMFPYLCNLKSEFTQYRLEQAGALRSLHSWRLLELLEQMKDKEDLTGWLSIDIADFHHAMEASASYRSNFGMLRKWVIEPSVKELNEKDNWAILWEPVKLGRRVATLKFKFKRDPQERLVFE